MQQVTYIVFRDQRLYGFLIRWNSVAISWRQQRMHLCKPCLQIFAPRRAMSHVMQCLVESRCSQLWTTQCLNTFHLQSRSIISWLKHVLHQMQQICCCCCCHCTTAATGFGDGGGITWTICKQSAPRSKQITTPTPHHSIFTGRMLFLTPN